MKVKWGALIVEGRGKLGGHVASRNTAGSYLRTKVTPINPQTQFQEDARERFGSLSQSWRGLTEVERTSWNAAVGEFATTDVFGDLKNPTGFNLFQKLNNNLLNVSQSTIDLAPTPSAIATVGVGVLTVDVGVGDEITIAMSGSVPTATSMQIWATPGLSAGKSFAESEFRLLQVEAAAGTSPVDIKTSYIARFGTPSVGTKVFVFLKFVNDVTGQTSPHQHTTSIVVSTT